MPAKRGVDRRTIHFLFDEPLPVALVEKLVKARIEENEARSQSRRRRS